MSMGLDFQNVSLFNLYLNAVLIRSVYVKTVPSLSDYILEARVVKESALAEMGTSTVDLYMKECCLSLLLLYIIML